MQAELKVDKDLRTGSPLNSSFPPSPALYPIGPPDEERDLGMRPPRSNPPRSAPPTWLIIGIWVSLSTSVIIFNQRLLVGAFPYPVALTTLHLAFQAVATRLLHQFTDLISGPPADYVPVSTTEDGTPTPGQSASLKQRKLDSVAIDWDPWMRQIVPPAALFSISLVLSNWAYLYLSVAYIHAKAFSPVAILVAAFLFGTKAFSVKLLGIVLMISFGTVIASYGEAAFSLLGFVIQVLAIFTEATRVTLIQILLAGKDMSPLKTLYYFAPICFVINAALILPVEGVAPILALPSLGFFTILLNCCLTFGLTLSTVYLIAVSSIVLSLSKVVKDIILVGGSTILLGEHLSALQVVGYCIATIGLLIYKTTPT